MKSIRLRPTARDGGALYALRNFSITVRWLPYLAGSGKLQGLGQYGLLPKQYMPPASFGEPWTCTWTSGRRAFSRYLKWLKYLRKELTSS